MSKPTYLGTLGPGPVKLGSELSKADQFYARQVFVHRHTGEHIPDWTKLPGSQNSPVQFSSDADWLANTFFKINCDGRLSGRRYCESRPTWPNNPELRKQNEN